MSKNIILEKPLTPTYDNNTNALSNETKPSDHQPPPSDNFYLAHMSSFLLGFMTTVPFFIISTAAGYWMFKFRDSSQPYPNEGKNRTTLQTYYQTSAQVAQQLPSILFSLFWTAYGHKLLPIKRTVWALFTFIFLYIALTAFTKINTDSWEVTFFIIVLVLLVINTALMATLQMSTVMLVSKLPLDYLMFFLVGQNGNLFVTMLQIICLAVTDDDTTTGLIYFGVNVVVMVLAFVLLMLARMTDVFKYYQVEVTQYHNLETLSWTESRALIKKIWPCLAIIILCYGASTAVHPSITTLVVSQEESEYTQWSKKYFIPVCAFLVSEMSAVLGRIVSKKIIINMNNKIYYIAAAAGRFLLLISIGLFLNAKPRTMPVLFGEDWEFAFYMFFFGFSQGVLLNISFMSMKSLAPGQQDVALKFASLTVAISSTVFVGNGLIAVRALSI